MITTKKLKPDEVNSDGYKFIKEENLPYILKTPVGFKFIPKSYERDNSTRESFYVEIRNKRNKKALVNCELVHRQDRSIGKFIVVDNDNNAYYTDSLSKAFDICKSVLYVQSKDYSIIGAENGQLIY